MRQVCRTWLGSVITLVCVSLFLSGCPKRPEVAETAPKPIGPQGAIAMPAPPPAPPTESAVPPTVSAPPEEQSAAEVTAQVQEAETPPAQETPTAPEVGIAPGSEPAEAEVKPEGQIKEGEARAPGTEGEGKPEAAAQAKESEVAPGTEAQVRGAEVAPAPAVTTPSAGGPPTEGVSPAAPVEPVTPAPVPTPPSPAPAVAEAPKAPELSVKDIYFDFDQAAIRDDARKTMADNIQWLRANSAAKVTIEGHCDERGSSEYNLALGERRARVTRDFLVAAGIEVSRINTISFGKERPFVLGHDESAWKWNRRSHFVLTTK